MRIADRNGDRLPNRRVKLYELAVQTLTEDWQLHKKLPDTSRVLLTQSEVVEFLAPLAYWMHIHKPSGVVPEDEVEQQLAEKLAELNDTEPESDSVRQAVQEFLRKVRETTGLFVERAPGVYGFMHLTFEEYFAARHIADYEKANDCYEQSKIAEYFEEKVLFVFWKNRAWCNRSRTKYEKSLEYWHKSLAIAEGLKNYKREANIFYNIGKTYQDRGKYEQAIPNYEQSRELYEQLGNEKSVAYCWYDIAVCYRKWGKYDKAIECELKDLEICQKLEDNSELAPTYYQLGRIYQVWGKYDRAVTNYQRSRELYEQLGNEKSVANRWYNLADCYQELSQYQQALECQQKCLEIRRKLDDQAEIASAYFVIGQIYQAWSKYEQAIANYERSRELNEQLAKEKYIAVVWYCISDCNTEWGKYQQALECQQQCLTIRQKLDDLSDVALSYYQLGRIYQAWRKYEQAIEYYQKSRDLHQKLGRDEGAAICCRQIADSQRLIAKDTEDKAKALDLLTQAEQNIHQAMQINTAGEYKENLAYDYTAFALVCSERLRFNPSLQEQITQFEEYYNTGFTYFTDLGQVISKADEALDIARAYLEVKALENLERAEQLAQESLQIFQEYNRLKLEAAARKLLGEIYLKRAQQNQTDTKTTATQFLNESLQIYQELELEEKASEVENLMHQFNCN